MPKILARDPAWLARPTPGYSLFNLPSDAKAQRPGDFTYDGSRRNLAHRGSEIFVAVGSEIRWSEVGILRDLGEDYDWKDGKKLEGAQAAQEMKAYRTLKVPVARPISQISISPSGDYIAVLTSHTCHVGILPPATYLRPEETGPLRLKSFQIGPTAHVLEQAPLVSVLWHPLSPTGDALVTVSQDACVRLWELNSEDRSSFNEPALSIDLKKLANARSSQSDFSASKYGTNRAFSPDEVEMQVAAACFGGQGGDDEHGWASMTLWIAMTEGDVYALCPFLPSTWRAPATLLPCLSTSVMERAKTLGDEASEEERRVVDQQTRWLAEVDAQESLLMVGQDEFETYDVYTRPKQLSPAAKLQGPFAISPELDLSELTDIFVIAPKLDDEALYDDNFENSAGEDGLSVSIICLATSTNEVHVCLDVDGVEAEWLPNRRSQAFMVPDRADCKDLVLFETIDLAQNEDDDEGCPTFTLSPNDRYEVFVTHRKGVCSLSFKPWVGLLESELAAPSESGSGFRLDVVLDSASTIAESVIDIDSDADVGVNNAIVILEPTLGFFILTSTTTGPFATILDIASTHAHPFMPETQAVAGALPAPEPRAPYRPAAEFDQRSALPRLIKAASDRKILGGDVTSQIRFSPATLQLLTEAHRIMSAETHRLGLAAADLFRRCDRMRLELQEQIRKVAEIAQRVNSITGQDEEDAPADGDEADEQRLTGKEKLDHRIEMSREKTVQLHERADALRKKMLRLGGAGLSAKEVVFAEEVGKVERSIMPSMVKQDDTSVSDSPSKSKTTSLATRLEAVQSLQWKLLEQAEQAVAQQQEKIESTPDSSRSSDVRTSAVGSEFRKQKLAQVMALLERETALVEAVMERLKRLQGVS